MMNGPDFQDERSRFSCWTAEISIVNGPDFMMRNLGLFIVSAKIP